MGFFWSGPNASFAGIWKRSARYWITTWVGNVLFGPPGHRRGSWRWKAANGYYRGDYPRIAYLIARDVGREAAANGRGQLWAEMEARRRFKAHMHISVTEADHLVERERRGLPPAIPAPRGASTLLHSSPAAILPGGSLRGGAAASWHAPKTPAPAVHRSGGLRGGAAKRWAK